MVTRRGHDESLGLDQIVLVRMGDNSGFQHGVVLQQRAFDLERRDVDPAHLHHVVGAAAVNVVAVGVEGVFIAGPGPRTLEGLAAFRALVPVHDGACRAGDFQMAEFSFCHQHAVVVDQP